MAALKHLGLQDLALSIALLACTVSRLLARVNILSIGTVCIGLVLSLYLKEKFRTMACH